MVWRGGGDTDRKLGSKLNALQCIVLNNVLKALCKRDKTKYSKLQLSLSGIISYIKYKIFFSGVVCHKSCFDLEILAQKSVLPCWTEMLV